MKEKKLIKKSNPKSRRFINQLININNKKNFEIPNKEILNTKIIRKIIS